ncbi:unnamed protein product [Vicia faba]|uniref:Uncharacterized protein n=1 Tax=Vicia faba TaxID=3906 RepID=A0AAV0ZAD3_VICFA|nr:unnamed protein product [Vicia faba]
MVLIIKNSPDSDFASSYEGAASNTSAATTIEAGNDVASLNRVFFAKTFTEPPTRESGGSSEVSSQSIACGEQNELQDSGSKSFLDRKKKKKEIERIVETILTNPVTRRLLCSSEKFINKPTISRNPDPTDWPPCRLGIFVSAYDKIHNHPPTSLFLIR